MAKSRDKVQQHGFWDEEVSKPSHDAVTLWAYENALQIARATHPNLFGRSWITKDLNWFSCDDEKTGGAAAAAFMSETERPEPRVAGRTLEYVLSSNTGYHDRLNRIIGYADLIIRLEIPQITPRFASGRPSGSGEVPNAFEVTWDRGSLILVEAKSVLPTLGELMRQIRLYLTAFDGPVVVVAPDAKYAKVLAEQRVVFVQCPVQL